jgi:hypothetical protein
MDNQNSHSKWLRAWAVELRKEGVIGGANTAEQAADEIDRVVAERDALDRELANWRSQERLLRASALSDGGEQK